MTREKATKIVTDFLNDMNPDMWDAMEINQNRLMNMLGSIH